MRLYIILLLFVIATTNACSIKYKKYESNWVVTKFFVNGTDSKDIVSFYNFLIDVESLKGIPPALTVGTLLERGKTDCNIDFFSKSGKDFIKITDHYFFSGTYEIRCLDTPCCKVVIENKHIHMELDYNGDLPYGKSRKCATNF